MASSTSRPASRYGTKPDPGTRRLALIPGLIAAIALLVGAVVLDEGTFTVIRYLVTIFAAIVAVFAFQAKQWWWLPPFAVIAIAWNPVWVIDIPAPWWQGAQYVAALAFLLAGWFIKVPIPEDQRR
ncbi:DUF6804 family protein [Pseudolysinimonas sp.]|jgi:hypothetical protein|uniref:DUF6804 family protein n=1 Tax=Pseudolysinimonas sp. TaxID=2680009 RepID=UPI003782F6A9